MSHTPTDYLSALRRQLGGHTSLSATEITDTLDEHRDLITELAATGADLGDELGDPQSYAEATAAEFDTMDEGPDTAEKSQGSLGGVPFDFRGFRSRGARRRIWAPQDPRIFQPHLFGLGWSINLGAVAVRLGLIRPDDIDADVVAAIPTPVMEAARAVPAILTAAAALTLAAGWRELPTTVPLNFTLGGEPRGRRYPKAVTLALPAAGAGLSALPYLPSTRADREDALRAASVGALIGAGTLGTAASLVAGARGHRRPGLFSTAALGLGIAASVGVLIGPFWAGLGRVWRHEGVR
ncbi:DUF5808 domain-containing protein [Corynebacterium halotolerans]|uniref:DUF5808 domain-containing protein n=1 Tax=Corynebacterium halotolerans YIM 70093 = DSM 44683 TaxID=1121362 RepID=M1P3E9_9CORY|nr:DUF5808 domain-containing protein [Corynebacterium halotolerans]AGF71216.1 hypothetical protein A605_01000 [Corynebacterium halotolerans YIM 70093 = DSM 44683]